MIFFAVRFFLLLHPLSFLSPTSHRIPWFYHHPSLHHYHSNIPLFSSVLQLASNANYNLMPSSNSTFVSRFLPQSDDSMRSVHVQSWLLADLSCVATKHPYISKRWVMEVRAVQSNTRWFIIIRNGLVMLLPGLRSVHQETGIDVANSQFCINSSMISWTNTGYVHPAVMPASRFWYPSASGYVNLFHAFWFFISPSPGYGRRAGSGLNRWSDRRLRGPWHSVSGESQWHNAVVASMTNEKWFQW